MHDTHGHLDILLEQEKTLKDFDNITEFNTEEIENSIGNHLSNHSYFFQATINTDNFLQCQRAFSNIKKVYYLIGSHPEIVSQDFDISAYTKKQSQELEKYLKNPKKFNIVGIGEIGLDYYYSQDKDIVEKQKLLFISQIKLAIKYDLPIQLHIRDAFEDAFEILEKYPDIHDRFLVHCFTGSEKELKKILDMGGLVAYGGVCTFKNAQDLNKTINQCPNDKFVLETDLPFLSPQKVRGKTCIPKYIEYTGEHLAKTKNLTTEEIWKLSDQNTKDLFTF